MSLSAVRNQQADRFGYHLITPNGEITSLAYTSVDQYRVDDKDPIVSKVYAGQVDGLANRGIYPSVMMPAKGGSVIAAVYESEAEEIHKVLFPAQSYERSAKVISFTAVKEEREASMLRTAFEESSEKYPVRANFRAAVGRGYVTDSVDAAPALEAKAA